MDEGLLNRLSGQIVDAAVSVHRELGPGLLESTYESCLMFELVDRGIGVKRQVAQPVRYRGNQIDAGYRIDLLVEDQIIIELKTIERILPIHKAQLLTYLRLSGKRVGLLLNFNVERIKSGIIRMVN